MSASVHALRLVAGLAALAGYAVAQAGKGLRRAKTLLRSEAGWRMLDAGGVRLRVPPGWGDLERDPEGVLTVHNRPRRFRIDGDAVWYSSAVELRIFPGVKPAMRNAEAMSVTRRVVLLPRGAATLELAIANGVGPRQRAIAEQVLASAVAAAAHHMHAPGRQEIGN